MISRVGEVEAAEWALDQAKAACDVQIAAALAAGVPAAEVATAAGVGASGPASGHAGTGTGFGSGLISFRPQFLPEPPRVPALLDAAGVNALEAL